MQIIPDKAVRPTAPKEGDISINVAKLTRAEALSIRRFLEKDPLIESVVDGMIEKVADRSERPRRPRLHRGGTVVAQCALAYSVPEFYAVEALIVSFLKDNKDAIEAAVTLGTAVALGGKYILKKLRKYCNRHKSKFAKIPIYDAKGNTIKFVKRKEPKVQQSEAV
jgi:hypothetical protein